MTEKHTDTHSYKGWLNSDKFWKRALAVWGHNLVAFLVIYSIIILFVVALVFILPE